MKYQLYLILLFTEPHNYFINLAEQKFSLVSFICRNYHSLKIVPITKRILAEIRLKIKWAIGTNSILFSTPQQYALVKTQN